MRKEFKRDIGELEQVFAFSRQVLDRHQVGEWVTYAVDLAIEEVFTNIVKFSTTSHQPIGVSLEAMPDRIILSLEDRGGKAFDMTEVAEVDTAAKTRQLTPGGLGIHLVKKVMDDVRYEYTNNTGTVTMIKLLENTGADSNKK